MKKQGIGIALLLFLIVAGIYTTFALFSDSQTKKGLITTGSINIGVYQRDALGNPYQDSNEPIVPGDRIARVATVKNEGTKIAWVRTKVLKELVGSPADFSLEELELIQVNYQVNWQAGADGYYYYSEPLLPGQETTPLFNEVSLNKEADNRFSNQQIQVSLKADGVQADNNGTDINDATGWPN